MVNEADQLVLPGFDEVEPSGAAIIRGWKEVGEQWEATRELFALLGDRGHYVYNIQMRWPKKASGDVMLIVKVFSEEGSHVAFHSGHVWVHLIPTFANRLRAGTVNWIVDEYPPDDWVEWFQILVNLPRIRR